MTNNILNILDSTIKKAEANNGTCSGDYRNEDGILICGKCHTPKEAVFNLKKTHTFYERFKNQHFPILCKCAEEQKKAEEKRLRQSETEMTIKRFRKEGITDDNYLRYTFSNDDNKNPNLTRACKKYADNFDDMYKLNKGLIFCGKVGTGKTFYAGCIANQLISQARSVLMTNIPTLITKLGYSQEEKSYILNKIASVSLLIIDDLGVERDTPYALEKIYEIIDTRYRAGKPLIVTTNLKYKDMKTEESVVYRRIYDRVLEMCHPIPVLGTSRRAEEAEQSREFMDKFLELD